MPNQSQDLIKFIHNCITIAGDCVVALLFTKNKKNDKEIYGRRNELR